MRGKEALKNFLARRPGLFRAAQAIYLFGRYMARKPHEPDFAAFANLPGDGLFLDVGANSGASALSFRIYKPNNPILSIEPSPRHAVDLVAVARVAGNMDVMFAAAGSTPDMLVLHTPYYRDRPLSHFASLDPSEVAPHRWVIRNAIGDGALSSDYEIRAQHTPVVRLDDLDLAPSFVKIDVQGFERQVLDGLSRTLSQHRPVLLLEVDRDWRDTVEHLAGLGYTPHEYRDGTLRPFTQDEVTSPNLFFCPTGSAPSESLGTSG